MSSNSGDSRKPLSPVKSNAGRTPASSKNGKLASLEEAPSQTCLARPSSANRPRLYWPPKEVLESARVGSLEQPPPQKQLQSRKPALMSSSGSIYLPKFLDLRCLRPSLTLLALKSQRDSARMSTTASLSMAEICKKGPRQPQFTPDSTPPQRSKSFIKSAEMAYTSRYIRMFRTLRMRC